MQPEILTILVIIGCTLSLFAWGRFRYDFVAMAALLAAVVSGVVPADQAFLGFGHPAVITVASVLIISRALQNSGVVLWLARLLAPTRVTTIRQVTAGSGLVALLSCIMNNVGALAIMLPVTIRNASKAKRSPSQVLMPLSFASLLGGLVTLIGTPTNIVISSYRMDFLGKPFQMFDFTPVGVAVAVAGLAYLSLVGWRLLPIRVPAERDSGIFHVEEYISEVKVPPGSSVVGRLVRQLERDCENELTVMSILRRGIRRHAPRGIERIQENDILVLEGDPSVLAPLINSGNLEPEEHVADNRIEQPTNDVRVTEVVLLPNSPIEGRSMRGLRMHDRYGINLLALSRRGERPRTRLANTRFQAGDVLLLQGESTTLEQVLSDLRLLELAERGLQSPQRRNFLLPILIFGAAIICVALGILPITIAFVAAVIGMIVFGVINARDVYNSIEWPVIVLLGALIPVGEALQATGGTALLAQSMIDITGSMPPWFILGVLLTGSMWLSDIIPNTPVAVVMAPIGYTIAEKLSLAPDPFLMAVAIGCATPFLTPIGHQSNTLVMNPGGYRFTDYMRMGLGLELIVILVAVPTILLVWPL